MRQKLLLFIFTLLSTLTVNAYDAEIDGIYYKLYGTEATITYKTNSYNSYSGNVTIPELVAYNGKTYSVTSIGDLAFSGCSDLTGVAIPNCVKSIGGYAFYNCSGLTSVTIPNSVTEIGGSAFSGCSGLANVTIGSGVTSIGSFAFSFCNSLASINIPNGVKSIGTYAFEQCTSLDSVTIGNSVTSIGSSAFTGCSKLTKVTIGNNVTSIGNNVFNGCTNLTIVTLNSNAIASKTYSSSSSLNNIFGNQVKEYVLGDSVTAIGECAFYNCSGLISVTISDSVTSIGRYAFNNCSGLTSVHIKDIATWCMVNFTGPWSNPLYYARHLYKNGKEIADLVIPEDVTSIGDEAFNYCFGLTSVTIGNSVTSIGNSAFYNCDGLTEVIIPNNVTSIGDRAFFGCSGLSEVYCYAEEMPNTGSNVFAITPISSATLHVPEASVETYKATAPWSGFGTIKTLSGDIPETQKCATPTITFENGDLTFSCETEDVELVYDITSILSISGEGINVTLPTKTKYRVTVYATKEGYENSDVATEEIEISTAGIKGDVNEDGTVNGTDIQEVIIIIVNAD